VFEKVDQKVSFPELEKQLMARWKEESTFQRSLDLRAGKPRFVFYEGPPTANGKPATQALFEDRKLQRELKQAANALREASSALRSPPKRRRRGGMGRSLLLIAIAGLLALALNEGLRCKKKLWRERGRQQLESFTLAAWASRRRRDLLELLDRFNPAIAELTQAIEREVENCPAAQRLRTHPGVGVLTALAFVLILGDAERFHCGKQVASYLGLVPLEDSSGNRRRLGHITKQGSSILRFLLVEAAQVTVRSLPEWRSKYFHLVLRRGRKIAKVAMARRLAVQLFWMMRKQWDYEQLNKFGSHAGQPGHRHGV